MRTAKLDPPSASDLTTGIDVRIAAQLAPLKPKPASSLAPAAPLAGGGTGGGSPAGGEPVLPERFVTSLQAEGTPDALSAELVLAAQGDISLTQSLTPPHFTFAVPVIAAADGVQRNGDEISCDGTVVRTNGNQAIDGVKSFTSFPLTPETAPDNDYEVANRKYVETSEACCETFPAVNGSTFPNLPFAYATYPNGANQAGVNTAISLAFSLPGNIAPGRLLLHYMIHFWSSAFDSETSELEQSQIAIGTSTRRFGNRAELSARVKVNNTSRFDSIFLTLCDNTSPQPNAVSSENLIATFTDGTWCNTALLVDEISEWSEGLKLTLSAQGTSQPANVGTTEIAVEYLALQQWRR